jgi:methionyl aminopeptidase
MTTKDISHLIQEEAWSKKLSVVTSLVGHGIGYDMHEWPGIPNVVYNAALRLLPHTFINPEPMFVQGDGSKVARIYLDDDGWSVMTTGISSHWETTFYYDGVHLRDIVGMTEIL